MTIIPYKELTIVGYNDLLEETMVPTVVPPVYRWDSDKGIFFLTPPFDAHVEAGVIGGNRLTEADFNAAVQRGDITVFPETGGHPREGYTLWIDQDFQPQYEVGTRATENLKELAKDLVKQAKEVLRAGNRDREALELARRAQSAADDLVDAYLVTAAIHKRAGENAKVGLMQDLASEFLDKEPFNNAVDELLGIGPACFDAPVEKRTMKDVALKPSLDFFQLFSTLAIASK